ncbi:MAG: xanthine dehydrogenase family protein subunit M, partial [Pseudomonadota bacterium]|nr:xanthine dehydrogenase family protein subunit M [Pseudomonadota bacterium]
MHAFEYHRPASTQDALSLASKKSEGRYLAGGQSLVQAMKLRLSSPTDLIDLGTIKELAGIKVSGAAVEIGAMTRHADVAGSAEVRKAIPALAALAAMIGDRQVRHMGTIGGALANSDPAADYPAAVLGLGATITTNKRKIEADKYFKGLYETALEPGELLTSVSFPIPKRAAYMKFRNPASRFALVGVFVADFGGSVRVAVTGAGPVVFRQADMEKALSAK